MSDLDILREAAAVLQRNVGASSLELAVADWLTAEATVIEMIPPIHKLIWGIDIEFHNGLSSVLQVGETEEGAEQLRASSTPHGLAVARAVLAAGDRAEAAS